MRILWDIVVRIKQLSKLEDPLMIFQISIV
jgi:hypothetical protein